MLEGVDPARACIAVVIPFYQRAPGLLRGAVGSVSAQTGLGERTVRIIVVDDASPSSPTADLADLALPPGITIEVIAQTNGGPGSARNRGIERAVATGCTHVAFLDSDDRWTPAHLATALAALEAAPFYFANSMHGAVPSFSYFHGMRGRAETGTIPADEAFALVLDECVPHTSQVVYVLSTFADVRFDETMRRTGEDHLFWLTIAARGVPLAYSGTIMGVRGEGVSVYRDALWWDSPTFVPRLIDAFRFRSQVAAHFALSPADARLNARHRREAAEEIAFALARNVVRAPARAAAALRAVAAEGPALWRAVAAAVPRLPEIRRRMTRS